MGTAGSTLEASLVGRRFKKVDLEPGVQGLFNFEDLCDASGTLSLLRIKTDLFLTHDWGVDLAATPSCPASTQRCREKDSALGEQQQEKKKLDIYTVST